jgi:hypothetical protein
VRLLTRRELAGTALGIIFATMLTTLSLLFSVPSKTCYLLPTPGIGLGVESGRSRQISARANKWCCWCVTGPTA